MLRASYSIVFLGKSFSKRKKRVVGRGSSLLGYVVISLIIPIILDSVVDITDLTATYCARLEQAGIIKGVLDVLE